MKLASLVLIGLCLGAPSSAAQEGEASPDVAPAGTTEVLRQRGREYLRLGDDPVLRGVEEGDNQFRDSTPVLASGEHAVSMVSLDENYARRRAMYSDGTTFHRPMDSRRVVTATTPTRSRTVRASAMGSVPGSSFSWLGWGALTLLGPIMIIVMIRRWKPRPVPIAVTAAASPGASIGAPETNTPTIEFLGGEKTIED